MQKNASYLYELQKKVRDIYFGESAGESESSLFDVRFSPKFLQDVRADDQLKAIRGSIYGSLPRFLGHDAVYQCRGVEFTICRKDVKADDSRRISVRISTTIAIDGKDGAALLRRILSFIDEFRDECEVDDGDW